MMIASDLLRKGYAVFSALTPVCFCSLIAIKDGKTYRLEVKTGYKSITDRICFSKTSGGEIDVFAVWERNSGEIYYLTPERVQVRL